MKDYAKISLTLREFLTDYLDKSGAKNFIVGVSGGLDSAVVAVLCKLANPNGVKAIMMPTGSSNQSNLQDAVSLCEKFDIDYSITQIDAVVESFKQNTAPGLTNLRLGNLIARIRMAILYDYSAALGGLVVGTSNKSERMLGYGTIYGDMACAINPIGDLFKTEIFELAKFLGIDEKIINKAPSADFWEGQSDEADLGYSYAKIDALLERIEQGETEDALEKKFDEKLVKTIIKRIKANEFKLKMPPIARINLH